MSPRPTGWRRFLRLWRPSVAADVDAELRFHFEQKVADLVAQGLSPESARARATAEFGDLDAVRSNLRAIDTRIAEHRQRAEWWEGTAQDVGYVLRSLRRSPAFTAMVAVTLALGLGANAAIFSLLDRMFFRPPAVVAKPNEVRRVHQHYVDPRLHVPRVRSVYNYLEFRAIRAAVPEGSLIAGHRYDHVRLGPDDDSPEAVASYVEGGFFDVLAIRPAAGRFFTPDEVRVENITTLAVISYQLWLDRYGGSQGAIGQSVDIGSKRYEIIGIAPKGFTGIDLDAVSVWVPMSTMRSSGMRGSGSGPPWYESPYTGFVRIIVRVPTAEAAKRVERAATLALKESKSIADTAATVTLASVIEAVWPDGGAKEVTISTRLAGVAAIILLIACANVANLFLVRAMQRRREIAVRLALGVSRTRLVRQLLTESMVLAFIGGAVALIVATWSATALRQLLLPTVQWGEAAVGWRLAAFMVVLAIVAGVGAGLVPALQSTRPDLSSALKAGAREGTYRRSRLRSALLVVQGALSVVLLAGAGLFVRSLRSVEAVNIGYDADRLSFASIGYELGSHSAEVSARLPELAAQLSRIPGVERVGLTENVPMTAFSFYNLFLPDRDSMPRLNGMGPIVSLVAPDYFAAIGVRVQAGRGFTDRDVPGATPVVVVSASLAQTYWPGENALSKCIILNKRDEPCRTVVGVASEAHFARIIEEPSMHLYLPLAQMPGKSAGAMVIRVQPGHVAAVNAQVRTMLAAAFGPWAHPRVRAMSEILAPELRPWRLGASLFSVAGVLALVVAAVGVYSTVSYTVSQRTHEMGVRVALGARAADLLRLVVGEGVRVVLVGVIAGAGIALALGRLVAAMLYNTSPRDSGILAAVCLTLLAVAVVACVIPAWRATRANPVEALRVD